MLSEASVRHPVETGGMMLGWDNTLRNELVVVAIIGPGPAAEHEPTRFRPDAEWQQYHLDDVYERSGGLVTYLGDWHAHPDGGFAMSRQDRRTMRRTAHAMQARCPQPLMGLLARVDAGHYRFGVWRWTPSIVPLHPGYVKALTVRPWTPTTDEVVW